MPRKKGKSAAGSEGKPAGGDGREQAAGRGRGGDAAGPAPPRPENMPAMPRVTRGGGRGISGGGRSGGQAYAPRPADAPAPWFAPGGAAGPGFVSGRESFPGLRIPQAAAGRGAPAAAPPGRGGYLPVVGEFPPPARAAAAAGGGAARGTAIGDPAVPPVAAPTPVRATAVEALAQEVAEMQMQPAGGQPASSKAVRPPDRPSPGTLGEKCVVEVNHFQMEAAGAGKDVFYRYRVDIIPTVKSRGLNRAVMRKLVAHEMGNKRLVFDGRNSLYAADCTHLPFTKDDEELTFPVVLPDERPAAALGTQAARERSFKVVIKKAGSVSLDHLRQFMERRQADLPQEVVQALDIVLREQPSGLYTPIGRSFFSPYFEPGVQKLGEGLVGWQGFYQSVRPTQMGLSLNVNMSATAFLEPTGVIGFVQKHLTARDMGFNFERGFSPAQRKVVDKALRRVRVEVTHRGDQRRKYRVSSLTELPAGDLKFDLADGTSTNVKDYFERTYKFTFKHVNLPCLNVGTEEKPRYIPMEVCKILPGQRCPARQLVERKELLLMTSRPPAERQEQILNFVQKKREDPYAKEFGIKIIADKFTSVTARTLEVPSLMYKDARTSSDRAYGQAELPRGAWNMMSKKFVIGGIVKSWACVSFDPRIQPFEARKFYKALVSKCVSLGMNFHSQEPVLAFQNLTPDPRALRTFLRKCSQAGAGGGQRSDLDLLIAIFPSNKKMDWYCGLKRICETEEGVVSQVCSPRNIRYVPDQYLANVALKINVKAGGTNTMLEKAMQCKLPTLGDTPTIIFGADVTHPSPGEEGPGVCSIAAVVASQDWPGMTTYAGEVRAQAGREEIIRQLADMVFKLLTSFRKQTGDLPRRILFYRDGVSEGQFNKVLEKELTAIQEGWERLQAGYKPKITFVVVQKRHHTRFFPVDKKDGDSNGNVLAGTVVDTQICHPREFDFYLCSHTGIKGTSRPAHYHVLWDDNEFTADSLQTLTNSLCSTYHRCTRSVSIVPPAYYAHHLAARARLYMNPESAHLPEVKERLKSIMYYC